MKTKIALLNKSVSLFLFLLATNISVGQTLKDEWVVCKNQNCKVLDPYFSKGVTLTWEGACTNEKADGYGKLTKYNNGSYESTYEGEYSQGIRQGKGKYTTSLKTVYTGQFTNGQLSGRGTVTCDDGAL